MSGLALALDISRHGLAYYAKNPLFYSTIARAKQRVEAQVENILLKRGHAGSIFWLKNYQWQDKQILETRDITEKTPEQLAQRLAEIRDKALAKKGQKAAA